MYSDLYVKKRNKLPFIFFVVISLVIAALVFLNYNPISLNFSFFQNEREPIKLVQQEIVNVGHNQIGIYWEAEFPTESTIIYGKESNRLNQEVSSDLNQSNSRKHFATLINLEPDTQYYYKIKLNDELISQENNQPFNLRTTKRTGIISNVSPAYGTVTGSGGNPVENAFIFLRRDEFYTLLTLTKPSGEWLIPMQYLVKQEDNLPVSINKDTDFTLQVSTLESESTIISVKKQVSEISPLSQALVVGYSTVGKRTTSVAGDQEPEVLPATDEFQPAAFLNREEISLLYPKENALIPGSQPLIKGTALPNSRVVITISTNPPISFSIVPENDGNWRAPLRQSLRPGEYTLTFSTQDDVGNPVEISRSFTILKSGEQVLSEATAAAGTSTPSPSVSEDLSPTGSSDVSPTESADPSPTGSSDVSPTESADPSPTGSSDVSPTESADPSPTGSSDVSPTEPTDSLPRLSPTSTVSIQPTGTLQQVEPTDFVLADSPTPPPPVSGNNTTFVTVSAVGFLIASALIAFFL